MRRKDRRKKRSPLLKIFLSLAILLIGAYVAGGFYYQSHFIPGTSVNGTSIGQKTIEKANELLTKEDSSPLLVVKENGKEIKSLTTKDLGVSPDYDTYLKEIKNKQNPWSYPIAFFSKGHSQEETPKPTEKEITTYATSLQKELDKTNEAKTPSQDAKLVLKGDKVEIQPEVIGTKIDVQKAIDAFKNALTDGKKEKTLELANYVVQPKVTKDDENLKHQADLMTNISSIEATYVINDNKVTIPKETLQSWIVFDGQKVTLNQELVSAYVNDLGNRYNTSLNPLSFASTKRGEVQVPAGSLGWTIKVKEETAALTDEILKGKNFERVPLTVGVGEVKGDRIGNTYIEVDLNNQHMWYYKDGKVALETDIVSGKPNRATPKGVFYVWNKERNATLRGFNDDGSKYASPVDFWMPIDWEGVGIHDSNWQPTYGGNWWVQNGSHGCINTPPAVMKQLFEMVTVDTPVIVL